MARFALNESLLLAHPVAHRKGFLNGQFSAVGHRLSAFGCHPTVMVRLAFLGRGGVYAAR